jgi:hypothetical protein
MTKAMSVKIVVAVQIKATNDCLEDKNEPHSDGVVILI